jgi:hypothetical protein
MWPMRGGDALERVTMTWVYSRRGSVSARGILLSYPRFPRERHNEPFKSRESGLRTHSLQSRLPFIIGTDMLIEYTWSIGVNEIRWGGLRYTLSPGRSLQLSVFNNIWKI